MPRPSKRPVPKPIKKAARKPLRRIKKTVRKIVRKVVPRAGKRTAVLVRAAFEGPEEPQHSPAPQDGRVPRYYGEDKLALLVRDPWWLFAYWEVTPQKNEEAAEQARRAGHRDWKTVLRVYDITQGGPDKPDSFFDIELNFYTDNWYIDVGMPDRRWMAELGLRTVSGKFFTLVRSNSVWTPAFGVSEFVDEEWMLPDEVYFKLIGFTGPGGQAGSMDIRKILEKYLKQVVSSERLARAPLPK